MTRQLSRRDHRLLPNRDVGMRWTSFAALSEDSISQFEKRNFAARDGADFQPRTRANRLSPDAQITAEAGVPPAKALS
jgi:hypothetical protein